MESLKPFLLCTLRRADIRIINMPGGVGNQPGLSLVCNADPQRMPAPGRLAWQEGLDVTVFPSRKSGLHLRDGL